MSTAEEFFVEHVPNDWFAGRVEVVVDRDEILVVGDLDGASVEDFREATRDQRVAIARVAEAAFDRKVSWAVRTDGRVERFTHLSIPVMTRLRIDERRVLDELIEGGIARSRSEALAWCVRLVDAHEGEWLTELRAAAARLAEVRGRGPSC